MLFVEVFCLKFDSMQCLIKREREKEKEKKTDERFISIRAADLNLLHYCCEK